MKYIRTEALLNFIHQFATWETSRFCQKFRARFKIYDDIYLNGYAKKDPKSRVVAYIWATYWKGE